MPIIAPSDRSDDYERLATARDFARGRSRRSESVRYAASENAADAFELRTSYTPALCAILLGMLIVLSVIVLRPALATSWPP